MPASKAAPTTTVSRTTIAGELAPIWPGLTTARSSPSVRSTMPSLPKPAIGRAGLRVRARSSWIAGRDQEDAVVAFAVAPISQAAIDGARDARSPRAPSSRRYIQSVSPVAASTATTSRRVPAVK